MEASSLPFGPALRQPDRRSCGAACVVVARLLRSHALRARLLSSFAAEVLAAHRTLTGPVDIAGRVQPPWPRMIGTPPWAVARALSDLEGVDYRTTLVRWSPGRAHDLARDVVADHPVALYTGSALLPRHVVLALAAGPDGLHVYDPATGRLHAVPRRAFAEADLRLGGWPHAWFVVGPADS